MRFYSFPKDNRLRLNKYRIGIDALPHGDISSAGFFIQNERGIGTYYAPDCEYCEKIVEMSEIANIVIIDATTKEKRINGHMTLEDVVKLAEQNASTTFLVTHRNRYSDDFDNLPKNVYLPEPGYELKI